MNTLAVIPVICFFLGFVVGSLATGLSIGYYYKRKAQSVLESPENLMEEMGSMMDVMMEENEEEEIMPQ